MKTDKKKITYSNEPIHIGKQIKDFLPPASELADAEVIVHEDIALPQQTVRILQKKAKEHRQDYKTFIRDILQQAAEQIIG